MNDYTKLRELAEACKRIDALHDKPITWFSEPDLLVNFEFHEDDCAYIAAASPDVVLGLLDEIDGLKPFQDKYMENRLVGAIAKAERDADMEAMRVALIALEHAEPWLEELTVEGEVRESINALRARLENT